MENGINEIDSNALIDKNGFWSVLFEEIENGLI
jgi:hypothetical protein